MLIVQGGDVASMGAYVNILIKTSRVSKEAELYCTVKFPPK